MTPLLLELEGFTCYRQRAVVDFTAASTGLFAVTGPTGAGKSTLLDAITYVLYGQTARLGGRGLEALISPGADGLAVQLTFRTARGVYRATRSAQRRSGSLASEVRVEESLADGAWRQLPASEKVREANRALEELVGLDYDSFTRAVLLPQGAFDEFLRGDASERRRLLVTLLGLDRVGEIQRLAGSRARDAETLASAVKTRLEEDYADAEAGTLRQLRDEEAELRRRLEQGTRDLAQLQEALDEALETSKLEVDLANVRTQLEQLEADKPTVSERRAELEAARRAALVAPLLPQVAASRNLSDRAEAELKQLRGQHDRALQARRTVAVELSAARERAAELTPSAEAEVEALTRLEPAHRLLLRRGASLAASTQATQAGFLDEEQWAAWQTAESHIPALQRANAEVERASRELEAARKADATAASEVTAHELEVQRSLQRGRELRSAEAAARKRVEEMQRADMAATLRAQLVDGEPCPVCGAADHDRREHGPSGQQPDLHDATSLLTETTAMVEAALAQHQLLTKKLASLEAGAAAAAQQLKAAGAAAARAEAAQRDAVALLATHGLAVAAATPEGTADQRTPAGVTPLELPAPEPARLSAGLQRRRAAALAAHARAISNELEAAGTPLGEGFDLQRRLEARRNELVILAKEVSVAERALESADREQQTAELRLKAAETSAQQRRDEASQAAAAVTEAVLSAGFADREAAEAALRTADRTMELEAYLGQHQSQLLAAQQRFVELGAAVARRPALSPLPVAAHLLTLAPLATDAHEPPEEGDVEPSTSTPGSAAQLVEVLRPRAQAQRTAIDDARGRLGALEHRRLELERRIERAKELREDLAAAQDSFELHRQLQLDLRGDRFQEHLMTQVQQRLARRASFILRQVTDGRFDLLLADGDYAVVDAWSDGEQRSARTLSGGESFVASLALALALSDTLAGSAALGALFLDEGFGTLDRETLDAVATVLESLTDEGRMVGVITHVPELSDRLPARLVVSKGPSGSTVAWDV